MANATRFSSPQGTALALPDLLELPPLATSPGKAPTPQRLLLRPRRLGPRAPADWACSPGGAAQRQRARPAAAPLPEREPAPRTPARAGTWRAPRTRSGRETPRGADAAGPRLALPRRSPTFC